MKYRVTQIRDTFKLQKSGEWSGGYTTIKTSMCKEELISEAKQLQEVYDYNKLKLVWP